MNRRKINSFLDIGDDTIIEDTSNLLDNSVISLKRNLNESQKYKKNHEPRIRIKLKNNANKELDNLLTLLNPS